MRSHSTEKSRTHQGLTVAKSGLGAAYYNRGNLEQAGIWYLEAAEEGEGPAQYIIGEWYRQGIGDLPQNPDAPLRWYCEAAFRDSQPAQLQIAAAYERGEFGLLQDPVLSHMWYNIAGAREEQARIEAAMSEAQVAEATNRARSWREGTRTCDSWSWRAR